MKQDLFTVLPWVLLIVFGLTFGYCNQSEENCVKACGVGNVAFVGMARCECKK